jgi:hypothetical protein
MWVSRWTSSTTGWDRRENEHQHPLPPSKASTKLGWPHSDLSGGRFRKWHSKLPILGLRYARWTGRVRSLAGIWPSITQRVRDGNELSRIAMLELKPQSHRVGWQHQEQHHQDMKSLHYEIAATTWPTRLLVAWLRCSAMQQFAGYWMKGHWRS